MKAVVKSSLSSLGLAPTRSWPFVKRLPFSTHGWRPSLAILTRLLPAPLLTEVAVPAVPGKPTKMKTVWAAGWGSEKLMHYFAAYERAFSYLPNRPRRILEIGVQNGGSLRMWRDYLGPDSTVVGIDIDPGCRRHEDVPNNIHVRIGSQDDPALLARLIEEFGAFDAIIDDGSHVVGQAIRTFGQLFDSGLTSPGIYIIEDAVTGYWREFRDIPYSFMDFARDLADVINAPYWSRAQTDGYKHPAEHVAMSKLASMITSVEMGPGLVTIYKADQPAIPQRLTNRPISDRLPGTPT